MRDMTRIRLEIVCPGQGEEAHEYEHCPVMPMMGMNRECPLGAGQCNFGPSEVEVPLTCPLKSRDGIMINVKLVKATGD